MAPPKWLGPVLIAAVIAGVGLFAFSVFWTQNEEIGQAKPTPAEPVDAEHVQADLDQADQAGPDQANQVDPNQAKPVDPLVRDALTRPLRMRLPVQAESGQESGPEMAAQNEPNQIMLTQAGQGVPDQAVSSSDHVEAGQKTSDEVKLAPAAHKILTIQGQDICKVTEPPELIADANPLRYQFRCPNGPHVMLSKCDFQLDRKNGLPSWAVKSFTADVGSTVLHWVYFNGRGDSIDAEAVKFMCDERRKILRIAKVPICLQSISSRWESG
eukprot:775842_1